MAFGVVDVLLTLVLGVAILAAVKMFFAKPSSTSSVKKPSSISGNAASDTTGDDKPSLVVYFGSQSGTAENFAYDFAEESKTYGFNAIVKSCEELVPEEFVQDKFSVFVLATHGEGEPTDDAHAFWEYITDANKDPAEYSNTYSVFALGNRQYRYFCAVGKRVDAELNKMGGERLLPMGVGDDDGTLDDDWETWRSEFWAAARLKFLNISATDAASTGTAFNAAYDVSFFPNASEQAQSYQRGASKMARFFCNPAKDMRVEALSVAETRELRSAKDGLESTAHVEFDLSNSKLTYRTADNLGVYPRNCHKAVGILAKRLGVQLDSVFAIKSKTNSSRRAPVPATCSVEDALLYCLDVNAALRSKIPSILATYTSNASERAKLLYYANDTQGKEEFHALRYNWVEAFEAFPGVEMPFAHFLELAPRMQPRYYTISSSSRVQPKQVAVTVSRFFADKPDQRAHVGVASDLLCRTVTEPKNREVLAFVRASSFRLPMRAGTPIIMIGPGTGIAPFKAFIQEFYTRKENKYGETVLYFGCRGSARDYLYKEELEQAKADGMLSQLHVALSREPGVPKTYVQDILRTNGEETWNLLNQGAYVFVCGATAMGNDVREIMCGLGHKYGGLTAAASEAFIDKLALQNKYVQELWSA